MIRQIQTSLARFAGSVLAITMLAASPEASALTSQTITFGTLSSQAFSTTPTTLSATASSGLSVAFSTTTTSVCTVSGNAVTMVATGTCTIAANQAGNATYAAAPLVQQSFSITSGTQTITFPAIANVAYGVAPFTLNATNSIGNAIIFASQTTGICTVSGSTATIVATGTCTVQAQSRPVTNYNPALNVSQSFTVNAASQTITFPALSNINLGLSTSANATASSGLQIQYTSLTASVCSVTSSGSINTSTTGTCTVAANQSGNSDYSAATQVTQSFTVLGKAQTITFSALSSKIYGSAAFTVSASSSSGLAVAFSSSTTGVCTVSGSTVALVAGGTCSIVANQAGNSTYAAAAPVTQSFTVTQAPQTISFSAPSTASYGSTVPLTASASSGLAVSLASSTTAVCTVSGSNATIVGAGTCVITANQAGNADYSAATQVSQNMTVNQVPQTISFTAPGNSAYGASVALSATATSGLAVSFTSAATSICTVSGTTATMVGVGTCSINANQVGNGGYTAAPQVSKSFTVGQASQAITFAVLAAKIFGQPTFVVSATSNSSLSVSFASTTIGVCTTGGTNGSTVILTGIGTCSIVASQSGNVNIAAATAVTQSFGVTADVVPGVTLTSPVAEQNYNAPATIVLTANASSSDATISQVQFFNGNTLIGTATQAPYSINWGGVLPGSYSLTANAVDNLGGTSTSAPVSITVANPLSISLTTSSTGQTIIANSSLTLNANASDTSGTVTQVAFYNGTALIGTTTQAPYTLTIPNMAAGSYVLTAQATDNSGNTATSAVVDITVVNNGGYIAAGVNKIYDVHTDQLKTPRMITDANSNAVWQWDNDEAFGSNLPNQDPNGTGNQFVFNLRYKGMYSDVETGTFYNYFRDSYDPARGAYNQSDPLGILVGQMSTYSYVAGNPLKYVDPRGLIKSSIQAGIEDAIARGDVEALQNLINGGGLTPAEEAEVQQAINAIKVLENSTSSTSQMAEWFGKTNKQIKKAIEICKQRGLPRNGPIRNPDVVVDKAGNVYPKLPNGSLGDVIGNIWDSL